jgi:hypothetical protein
MIMSNCSQKIFPDNLKSGSITSQEELDDAFAKYSNLSCAYVQTAVYWEEYREWYEKHWPTVCKYLDHDFLDNFKMESEHTARAWEFHIATVLTEQGLHLEEKTWKYGPDFCIKLPDGRNLWIEAIACDLGNVDPVEPYPDMTPGVMYSFGGNIEDSHRPRALRITSAIGTKFEKFKGYLENSERSGVQGNDCLLIAVNGSSIQHHSRANMLFKRSVFGQGPDVYVKVPGKEKLQGPFYKPTPTIIKNAGGKNFYIPANFMEMEEFSKISGVLYCGHPASHSWNNGYETQDDFLFAYHTDPNNPIPDDFFKFGRGIRKDLKKNHITDSNQKEGLQDL